MQIKIRPETFADFDEITRINDEAFGQKSEGLLICALRTEPIFDPRLSLVAQADNSEIVGHLLLTPILIQDGLLTHSSLALAPVAVASSMQRQGVGSLLIQQAISVAKAYDHGSIIVLGHHSYYPRFGFKPASLWNIRCPFDVSDEAFMAIELKTNALSNASGMVKYPAPFYAL